MDEGKLVDIYKSLFETWRSQVDSYWKRSDYFAAFETAAIAGCWHLLIDKHVRSGCILSVFGILLTAVWLHNNYKVHNYVLYWWKSLEKIEVKLDLKSQGIDFVTKQQGGGSVPYHHLIQIVPTVFLMAWIMLFIWSLLFLCACPRH